MWMELKDIGKYLRARFILVVLTFNEPYIDNEVNLNQDLLNSKGIVFKSQGEKRLAFLTNDF